MATLMGKRLFRYCPKTGKIVGLRMLTLASPLVGLGALLWYLLRVLPKPSRATYPCQRVAAPIAASYLAYLAGAGAAWGLWRRARHHLVHQRRLLAAAFLGVGTVAGAVALSASSQNAAAGPTGIFVPSDAPNKPIGTAQGIHPGRVAWAWDPNATSWDGTGTWWEDAWNDQPAVDNLLKRAIQATAGVSTLAEAWNAIFVYHNQKRGRGAVGYKPGEKIAIKPNLNNRYTAANIDSSPHLAYALLDQLVNTLGVAQSDITIYDAMRSGDGPVLAMRKRCQAAFPNVNYNPVSVWVAGKITYSAGAISTEARRLPEVLVNATYLINMPVLKRHCQPSATVDWVEGTIGQTAVSLGGKSHCGTVGNCATLHVDIRDWNEPMGSYNPLVDIWADSDVGGKTLLTILDGLYGSNHFRSPPQRWQKAPFNGDWPSSVFVSQDKVAIDSVGLDFLRAEMDLASNADNYLHEAALLPTPPSGTKYQPDGVAVENLGVHEHWTDATKRQYSRNLGTGQGIELCRVGLQTGTCEGEQPGTGGSAGMAGVGGSSMTGGTTGTGGVSGTGGTSTGGATGTAGMPGTGGASGGTTGTGGVSGTGGTSTGGATGTAGMPGTGGASATAGATGTGGSAIGPRGGSAGAASGAETAKADSGCACRASGSGQTSGSPLPLLGLLLLLCLGLRRRDY